MSHPAFQWSQAYTSLDATSDEIANLSDTQCLFAVACVGIKRTAYHDGDAWTYDETQAKLMPRADAVKLMAEQSLHKYCRLIRQPHPDMRMRQHWNTSMGYMPSQA